MRKQFVALIILFSSIGLLPGESSAQIPTIAANGIRNIASQASTGLPNAAIAQGSVFLIDGQNMGPVRLVGAFTYPLPTSQGLAGTSIKITVGNVTVDAIMLFTSDELVVALLPSNTPVGTGSLTLTYNGASSAPTPISIARSSFGIFTQNQSGSGPGVIQNLSSGFNGPINTVTESALPGQRMTLWGTGLGPVSGNEAAGPIPGDIPGLNLKVWVGAQEAVVESRGRTACCVGIDYIVFILPEDLEGCFIPVAVQIDDIVSNFVTIAIDSSGNTCSDPGGLSQTDLETAESTGNLRVGFINLSRSTFRTESPGMGPIENIQESSTAGFYDFTYDQLTGSQSVFNMPSLNGCSVTPIDLDPDAVPVTFNYLSAGQSINLNGPNGAAVLQRLAQEIYFAILGQSVSGVGTLYLSPGTYTFNNGNGGTDVGPFQVSHNHDFDLGWSNEAATTSVNRSEGVMLTWTGGASGGSVFIFGSSTNQTGTAGATFFCIVDSTLGSFTVPSYVLLSLPPSGSQQGVPFGTLGVGIVSAPTSFQAPGLDAGYVSSNNLLIKSLLFE